ncbi:MAG: XDD4 family exosortase-dependent surface protein [Planctomycetota bacterium]
MRHPTVYMMIAGVLGVLIASGAARADLSWAFAQDTLAARATFATEGTMLKVTLTNTSAYPVVRPEEVLSGVSFKMPGITLDPVRAVLADGSSVVFPISGDGLDSNGEVGGEYAYRDDMPGIFGEPVHTISAVGMGDWMGVEHIFPGENLQPPVSPNGIGYGLISYSDGTGNWPVSGKAPLVQNSVIFFLDGMPDGYNLSGILGVKVNYGSDICPYTTAVVPAPTSVLAGLLGLSTLGAWLRRRRRSSRPEAP